MSDKKKAVQTMSTPPVVAVVAGSAPGPTPLSLLQQPLVKLFNEPVPEPLYGFTLPFQSYSAVPALDLSQSPTISVDRELLPTQMVKCHMATSFRDILTDARKWMELPCTGQLDQPMLPSTPRQQPTAGPRPGPPYSFRTSNPLAEWSDVQKLLVQMHEYGALVVDLLLPPKKPQSGDFRCATLTLLVHKATAQYVQRALDVLFDFIVIPNDWKEKKSPSSTAVATTAVSGVTVDEREGVEFCVGMHGDYLRIKHRYPNPDSWPDLRRAFEVSSNEVWTKLCSDYTFLHIMDKHKNRRAAALDVIMHVLKDRHKVTDAKSRSKGTRFWVPAQTAIPRERKWLWLYVKYHEDQTKPKSKPKPTKTTTDAKEDAGALVPSAVVPTAAATAATGDVSASGTPTSTLVVTGTTSTGGTVGGIVGGGGQPLAPPLTVSRTPSAASSLKPALESADVAGAAVPMAPTTTTTTSAPSEDATEDDGVEDDDGGDDGEVDDVAATTAPIITSIGTSIVTPVTTAVTGMAANTASTATTSTLSTVPMPPPTATSTTTATTTTSAPATMLVTAPSSASSTDEDGDEGEGEDGDEGEDADEPEPHVAALVPSTTATAPATVVSTSIPAPVAAPSPAVASPPALTSVAASTITTATTSAATRKPSLGTPGTGVATTPAAVVRPAVPSRSSKPTFTFPVQVPTPAAMAIAGAIQTVQNKRTSGKRDTRVSSATSTPIVSALLTKSSVVSAASAASVTAVPAVPATRESKTKTALTPVVPSARVPTPTTATVPLTTTTAPPVATGAAAAVTTPATVPISTAATTTTMKMVGTAKVVKAPHKRATTSKQAGTKSSQPGIVEPVETERILAPVIPIAAPPSRKSTAVRAAATAATTVPPSAAVAVVAAAVAPTVSASVPAVTVAVKSARSTATVRPKTAATAGAVASSVPSAAPTVVGVVATIRATGTKKKTKRAVKTNHPPSLLAQQPQRLAPVAPATAAPLGPSAPSAPEAGSVVDDGGVEGGETAGALLHPDESLLAADRDIGLNADS